MSRRASTRALHIEAHTPAKVNIPGSNSKSSGLTRQDTVSLRPSTSAAIGLAGPRYQDPHFVSSGVYVRARCSPYRAKVLRAEPYLVDVTGRRILYRSPSTLKPRSRRHRARSSEKSDTMESPCTPVKQQGHLDYDSSDESAGTTKRASYMTPDVPTPPPKDTPRQFVDTPRPKKISPLDKALPSKPALRPEESPLRRGILDATDSAAKRSTICYPPLKPSNIIRHRPSMSDSSFKITPSLRSVRGSGRFVVDTASVKEAKKVSGLPVTITSQKSLHPTASRQTLVTPSGGSVTAQRAVSLSRGHVGTYKNGSPIQRGPAANTNKIPKTPIKFNRRKTRDFQVLNDESSDDGEGGIEVKIELKQALELPESIKANFDVDEYALDEDYVEESPARSDSDRRFVKLGVGPTVRYASDAREVLLGKSPNVLKPLKSSKYGSYGKLNDSPYPMLPKKSVNVKELKSRFNSSENSASRLARPTALSAAREKDAKAKIEARKSSIPTAFVQTDTKNAPEVKRPGKGIRSRVSDLIYGRRRSAQQIVEKSSPVVEEVPAPLNNNKKKLFVRDVSNFNVTNTGEPSDRFASRHAQQEPRNSRQEVAQAHIAASTVHRAHSGPARRNSNDNNGTQQPSPPASRLETLRAHYLEDAHALQTEDSRLESAIAGVQASLDDIIAQTQGIEYPGFRSVVEPIIRSLAASIISAQNARVAVLGLGNASQRVMTDALIMSENIGRAAAEARNMVGEIGSMAPES